MRDKNTAEPQEDLEYKLENASTHFSHLTFAFISGMASFSLSVPLCLSISLQTGIFLNLATRYKSITWQHLNCLYGSSHLKAGPLLVQFSSSADRAPNGLSRVKLINGAQTTRWFYTPGWLNLSTPVYHTCLSFPKGPQRIPKGHMLLSFASSILAPGA